MKIAVTSQNRKTITGHAGKCRKFWIYEVEGGAVRSRQLLELPIEQSFHESEQGAPHPLDDVNVLISGGMGMGLQARLKQMGILAVATGETDIERAVAAWLDGTLVELPADTHLPGLHHYGHHEEHHGSSHDHAVVLAELCGDDLSRPI
ncbi:MAG: NifB/NifX family molybdenum-iron cluster-binding protein [Gallionellaceae bacterium]|nr:NifB/NifX family molybdenum-iron cluster-binding protein [Gallionellaceae bacterium]